jgi:hypothetical protein
MAALVRHVALVSESNRIKMKDLMTVSAALQKQAARDSRRYGRSRPRSIHSRNWPTCQTVTGL